MPEKVILHDFIEIEYTGRFTNGTVFDTTDKETAEKNSIFSPQFKYGPVIICLGEKQLIPGLDNSLLGKEIGQTYTIELKPEQAFGKKDFKKIRLVPIAEFRKRKLNPQPGMQLDFDGEIGTIIRASGGRILVNFNHPFAGREVIYQVKINKKITDPETKLKSFLELSLNFPDIKTKIEEGRAVVILPLELPLEVKEKLSKKLKEIIHLKEITFQAESPKTTPKQ